MSPRATARVALVTCQALPGLSDDDQHALPVLAARGMAAEPVVWNDPAVRWSDYDLVVIRSAWDYYHHPAAFAAWIDRLDAAGVPLWNTPRIVRANLDKRYLASLADAGVPIVPTVYVENAATDLPALFERHGWTEAVIKPVISAAAHRTHRLSAHDQRLFDTVAAHGPVMLQPYLPEIETAGEWSVIYLGGAYSHAVRKVPRAGDFRVQPQHGGQSRRETPPAHVLAAADRLLASLPDPVLYARVDGVERGADGRRADGEFQLMELELIEPRLFFAYAHDACERFADAIEAVLA
jgi:glutathione synthase/RimK-type ligase-like ATP-grasp enzyme